MTELITRLFVEQPLASPGSAKKLLICNVSSLASILLLGHVC